MNRFETVEESGKRWLRLKRRCRLLGLLLLAFTVLSLFGDRGLLTLYTMYRTKAELKGEIGRLKRSIEELKREVRLLQRHPERLEELAREALGLVRPGEIVYQFGRPEEPERAFEKAL